MSASSATQSAGWSRLDIGDQTYGLLFAGHDQPLAVALADLGVITLRPWTYRDHLAGLRASLVAAKAGLHLDPLSYLAAMLAQHALPPHQQAELLPVALWWASGAGVARVEPGDDGQIQLDGLMLRLRPWSERARQTALRSCFHETISAESAQAAAQTADSGRFDAVGYLDAMVRAGVVAAPAGFGLDDLAAHWALPLIAAVVDLNLISPATEPLAAPGPVAQASAANTLRICRALGWTPSQVWAAPAVEIDRLLALLDAVEPTARSAAPTAPAPKPLSPRPPRRLADLPDAVLIRIED